MPTDKSATKRIVLASNNAGKLTEMQPLFAAHGFDVIAQRELGVEDAEETGLSFVENAIIKARHAAKITGLAAISDDSGLEVDALDGAPGIYSARFSGQHGNDANNNRHLLEKLQGIPDEQRTARYHCVLVYLRHATDPTPAIFHGSWEGRILTQAVGEGGFGYDPLFYVPDYGCSAAQMDKAQKNSLSHRAQAMQKLADFLLLAGSRP